MGADQYVLLINAYVGGSELRLGGTGTHIDINFSGLSGRAMYGESAIKTSLLSAVVQ